MAPDAGIRLTRTPDFSRADIAIERPPVNVLDVESLQRLAHEIALAPPARVLLLRGLPRAFSAGVEVAEHEPEPSRIAAMLSAMRGVLESLLAVDAVTVAVVSGACLGGGAEIASACDLVLAAEDAKFGFPEIRLACFPPGAAALLPAAVGAARAADWILTGRSFSGVEAAQAGLAARALPADALESAADALAAELTSRGARALAAARDLVREPRRRALEHVLPRAEEAYRGLAGSEELREAVRAFREKR
ncbi:MAG TPA: enoyl-CoA hydratase/isomerase family protein [Thermoanaerobaculia bacterium]